MDVSYCCLVGRTDDAALLRAAVLHWPRLLGGVVLLQPGGGDRLGGGEDVAGAARGAERNCHVAYRAFRLAAVREEAARVSAVKKVSFYCLFIGYYT